MSDFDRGFIGFISILAIIIVILWIFLPFAIFGMKDLIKELIIETKKTNKLLEELGYEVKTPQQSINDNPLQTSQPDVLLGG